ncbi:MAG: metal-dependent transcriptional regulator [Aigarchaeota archaeon]|nr:metal-dependent transcriptional regulator [Aigarchaeota archaeon]MDW8093278.1 metal-dependent transcriptional regulator [Nitrososphaerota archaeon]
MPKTPKRLSTVQATYLTEILKMTQAGRQVTTGVLAERFKVRPPTVVGVMRELESKGLLKRVGWGRVDLTDQGRGVASDLIHVHRVIETYFANVIGIDPERSCRLARSIETAIRRDEAAMFCKLLNYPDKCVHGEEVVHAWCRDQD